MLQGGVAAAARPTTAAAASSLLFLQQHQRAGWASHKPIHHLSSRAPPCFQVRQRCFSRSCSTSTGAGSTSSSGGSSSSSSMDDEREGDAGKLNILCLHGFLQTGSVFRMRIGSLRKGLKSRATFAFQDAPFHAASTLTQEQVARFGGSADGLTWFQWQDLGPDKRPSLAVRYAKWDETYAALCGALRASAPDGLLGFSQGATAVALFLAALAQAQREGRDLDVPLPQFCIVCAGFLPNDPQYADLLRAARVSVPSLFIIGESDALIPPHRTQELLDTFDPAAVQVLRHPGAHYVPTCTGDVKQQLCDFVDRFQACPSLQAAAAGGPAHVAGASLESMTADEQQQPDDDGGEGAGFPEVSTVAAGGRPV